MIRESYRLTHYRYLFRYLYRCFCLFVMQNGANQLGKLVIAVVDRDRGSNFFFTFRQHKTHPLRLGWLTDLASV